MRIRSGLLTGWSLVSGWVTGTGGGVTGGSLTGWVTGWSLVGHWLGLWLVTGAGGLVSGALPRVLELTSRTYQRRAQRGYQSGTREVPERSSTSLVPLWYRAGGHSGYVSGHVSGTCWCPKWLTEECTPHQFATHQLFNFKTHQNEKPCIICI